MTATTHRRLWLTAGWLMIGYIVLTFAGISQEHSLMLGDKPSSAAAALVHSSMAKNFAGGYVELLATIVLLVGSLLIARLVRGDGVTGDWLSSCISAGAVVQASVTLATGFAAGAAALYDGHHGASLSTVTTVNDIRNFGFFVSGAAAGLFALAVSAAVLTTRVLPRWVAYSGVVIGVLYIASIPAARTGIINAATLLGFVWLIALAVAAMRQARRPATAVVRQPVPATG